MGNKGGSTPEQQAKLQGRQISAANWLQRLKQTQIRQQQTQTVSKADLQRVQLQLKSEIEKSRANRTTIGQAAGKGAHMMAKGFSDISKSLATPSAPGHRPKIAQMPSPRNSPMKQSYSLDNLKMPSMRARDITGRRVK